MKRHPVFHGLWFLFNLLLLTSSLLLVFGILWEFATREYLKGFADAIVPLPAPPEKKLEAIVTWMRFGPERRDSREVDGLSRRDPQNTLEYERLLKICGTATNAFVNLAASSDLEARRLLLLDSNRLTKHVVAEVLIDGRWIVVDPAFRFVFRDPAGRPLTRQELRDPIILRQATAHVKDYPPSYTYESTVQVRLGRLGPLGLMLRKALDKTFPSWEESVNWTNLTERASLAFTVATLILVLLSFAALRFLDWYGGRRLGIERLRLREQISRAGQALFSIPR
jgi:hypothetical protein